MLSTDTHTTSIILLSTSLPQPPPESQRHPQINSCTETSAEQTIWSQCSPGPAVFWAELLLLLPATTALALLGAGTQGAAPRQHHCFFAGEHHASPNLIQLPSTCTTCCWPRETPGPATNYPQATQALPQEKWGGSLLLVLLLQLLPCFSSSHGLTQGVSDSAAPQDTSFFYIFLQLSVPNLL